MALDIIDQIHLPIQMRKTKKQQKQNKKAQHVDADMT
jgi:hypothetical protein